MILLHSKKVGWEGSSVGKVPAKQAFRSAAACTRLSMCCVPISELSWAGLTVSLAESMSPRFEKTLCLRPVRWLLGETRLLSGLTSELDPWVPYGRM